MVAVAPWLSDNPECALPYIQATQADPALGLIFFPTRPTASIGGPVRDNPDWGVDGSTWRDWIRRTEYSIWGVRPEAGARLVQEMAKYSGNVSVAPFGTELSQRYPPDDAIRLFARIGLDSSNTTNPILSRLWVFAIMILAILCVVTGFTSLIMHLNQRRLRRDLRRRIANGEVDLEVLGIKRQNVPQKVLDKMPLYVYTSKLAPLTSAKEKEESSLPTSMPLIDRQSLPKRDVPFSQTTCPICLEDFEHHETIVRELPCQHIFHPECVDEFLRSNSSLCPMCKKSALPIGYCPEDITISMVRRERMVRRLRETGNDSPRVSHVLPASAQRFLPGWFLRARTRPRQGAERLYQTQNQAVGTSGHTQQQGTTPTHNTTTSPLPASTTATITPSPAVDLEMGNLQPAETHPQTLDELPPEIQALSAEERREWGRQRLAATLPPAPRPVEEERQARQTSGLKRAWKKMFPS